MNGPCLPYFSAGGVGDAEAFRQHVNLVTKLLSLVPINCFSCSVSKINRTSYHQILKAFLQVTTPKAAEI